MSAALESAVVVLLAAGSGTRFGSDTPKQLQRLGDKSLVQLATESYRPAGLLVVVHHPGHGAEIRRAVEAAGPSGTVAMVAGGSSRRKSIERALHEIDRRGRADDDLVVLQNAASPHTPEELVRRCLEAAESSGAAQAYVPCHHTVVMLTGRTIDSVLPRDELGYTADPTVYRLDVLRRAMAGAAADTGEMTLDLVRGQGVEVTAVMSPTSNVKVTVPSDLDAASGAQARPSTP